MDKCLACSGPVVTMAGVVLDQRGVCRDCGAVFVGNNNKRTVLATEWCKCKEVKTEHQVFYMAESGEHGWLHTVCGQITQTG